MRSWTPLLPRRLSAERGGCAYLVAPTLGVHKHQQGLHEGGWGGPDDEGSPAALLGDRETVRLYPGLADLTPVLSGGPSRTASGADLKGSLATERQLESGPPPSSGAQSSPKAASAQRAQYVMKQAPLFLFPSSCPPSPKTNLWPFLARFPLEGCSLFLLACLEGILKRKQGHW